MIVLNAAHASFGLIDELTPDMLSQIDATLVALAAVKRRKVAGMIGRLYGSPAHVPGLPDYFYLERVRLLVQCGVLKLAGNVEDLMQDEVYLP